MDYEIRIPKGSKICTTCNYVKTGDNFDKGKRICKACRKIYNANIYKKRKEKAMIDSDNVEHEFVEN